MGRFVVKNAVVATFGEEQRVLHGTTVVCEGKKIAGIWPDHQFQARPDDTVLDADGRLLTPGLVNLHMHFYSTFARGLSAPVARNFPEILEKLWWRLDRSLTLDDVYLSALVSAIGCVKAGVTTVVDHHASFDAIRGSLRKVAQATTEVGIRACLAYEVSDRGGPQKTDEAIEENLDFAKYSEGKEGLAAMFGLHASFTLSDETLERCARAGERFHVHCAEDVADVEHARKRGFSGALDRLCAFGVVNDQSILAHCIHLADQEIEKLADSGAVVVCNPQSNMNNAVGVTAIARLLDAHCTVGMGSDGFSCDIKRELVALMLSQRQEARDPTIMFGEAWDMLSRVNPATASRLFGTAVGVIEPGANADLVLWDYYPPTPLSAENLAGHFMFGVIEASPLWVTCNGRVLLRDGRIQGVDERAVAATARDRAQALWERFLV